MNKGELALKISAEAGITQRKAEEILNLFIKTVLHEVACGDDVKLIGLGTFTKMKRKSREHHNPQTMEKICVPARWYPKFRPGAEFKDAVSLKV